MYYELYVDVLFLVNFTMDYFLLLLVKRMLKCSATHGNICIGAVAGAFFTCLIVVLPVPYAMMKFVMFHVVVNAVMIKAGLKIKDIRNFVKALIMLYTGGFLLGGVMGFLQQYVKIGSLFLLISILTYYLASWIWKFIYCMQKINQYKCDVELYFGEKKCCVRGMIDTGNGLRDPISNDPVNILDREYAKIFFGNQKFENFRYIPYHSIGKEEGVLLAVKIDKMCVKNEKIHWVHKPMIAISEEKISKEGEYKMILNPNIF